MLRNKKQSQSTIIHHTGSVFPTQAKIKQSQRGYGERESYQKADTGQAAEETGLPNSSYLREPTIRLIFLIYC